jgi:hypothetical protein
MSELPGVWGASGGYLAFFVAGFLASEPWRWAGAQLGRDIDPASPVFLWVKAVATAIVAGLVSRMMVFPTGALADVDGAVRAAAFGAGIAAHLLARGSLGAGIVMGSAVLIAGRQLL